MSTPSEEKPDESAAAAPLDRVFERDLKTARSSFQRAERRASLVSESLARVDKGFIKLARRIGELEAPVVHGREQNASSGELHTMSLVTAGSSDHLFFAVPPYDEAWTTFQPPGASSTQARGPSADKARGTIFIDLIQTYVDRPVAEGGWMYAGAGVGVWFKPKSPSTYVRVSGYVPYDYDWADSSSLQVAHNRAELGVMVLHWRGPGDLETVIDHRDQLWSDGTSWYEDHSDSGGGHWSNQNYFFGSSSEWYLVWFWCNGGIDFSTKDTFGSSKAFQSWGARIPFIVFEQWG